jgi:hypothetical protein
MSLKEGYQLMAHFFGAITNESYYTYFDNALNPPYFWMFGNSESNFKTL